MGFIKKFIASIILSSPIVFLLYWGYREPYSIGVLIYGPIIIFLISCIFYWAKETLFPEIYHREICARYHNVGSPSPFRQRDDGTWYDPETGENLESITLSELLGNDDNGKQR